MDERLSAFADGELEANEAAHLLNRLGKDDALRDHWSTYHLIGDVLRGTAPVAIDRAALAARMAGEPAIIAQPKPAPMVERAVHAPQLAYAARAGGSRTWLSAVAGVAAVGFVGWVAWPSLSDRWGSAAPIAAAPRTLPVTVVPVATGVVDYLFAHQPYSMSSTMQGAVPYVRVVSEPASVQPGRIPSVAVEPRGATQ